MLRMAGETDDSFTSERVVADFGCGPRGSLVWAEKARVRIGIDVLADSYVRFGIPSQNMAYIVSTEASIPLPSRYVDIMFTMNSMDHVANLSQMCDEIHRVIAPGGTLIASFNLNEPATVEEPQTLTMDILWARLLSRFDVHAKRLGARNVSGEGSTYKYMFTEGPPVKPDDPVYLWVRGTKK